LHSYGRRLPDNSRWQIKYFHTNGGEFDRVINSYGFDTESFEEEIPFEVCEWPNIIDEVRPLHNVSGYVFCTDRNKGIKQLCPPDTELSYEIGGCVNKTTNTTVFPIGSRCASQPCQNGGVCFDLSSVDSYVCHCSYPYKGLHCHLLDKSSCPISQCGRDRVGKFIPVCRYYTTDKALDYICFCYSKSGRYADLRYAANNCYTDELFSPKCEGEPPVGALPFTNKGFYICPMSTKSPLVLSCPLHHVWNNTQKECVLENNQF